MSLYISLHFIRILLEFSRNGIIKIKHGPFLVWFLSISIIIFRFIYVVVYINSSFLFIALYYSIIPVHSSTDKHFGYFPFVLITNKTIMKIWVNLHVDTCFHFSWVNSWECNDWVIGKFMLNFLEKWHTVSKVVVPLYILTSGL